MSFFRRIFRRDDYSSEISQFIDQLKSDQPDLEARQRAGRAIFWDKPVDRAAQSEWREASIAQKPYVYGSGE